MLLTRYRDIVLHTLMQAPFETVKAFEQSTRVAKPLIVKYRVWEQLFFRDFPDTYAIAIDDKMKMRYDVKKRLDQNSARPNNVDTYWKRYYELKRRPYGFDRELIDNITYVDVPELLHHPVYNFQRVHLSFFKASARALPNTIGFWVANYMSLFGGMNEDSELGRLVSHLGIHEAATRIKTTSNMMEVSYNNQTRKIVQRIVPFDATLYGKNVSSSSGDKSWQSVSGFETYVFDAYGYKSDVFVLRRISEDEPLVSTCVGCNIEPVAANCGGLCNAPLYCSQSCAQSHYATHKQDCNSHE